MIEKNNLHILIVDDEEIIIRVLTDYLEDLGHSIISAQDGLAALDLLQQHIFYLVLIDIRMPGMDGISLLEKIKEIQPDLPVVIMTGHASKDTSEQALSMGAAGFLVKPIKIAELDKVLDIALKSGQ